MVIIMFKIKRAYQSYDNKDGFRVLVDRLWPRGVSKEKLQLDLWMKEIAPSTELRKWFGHDPERWNEFKKRYLDELNEKKELIEQLNTIEKIHNTVTLVYSAKDEKRNNAIVLMDLLNKPPRVVRRGISRTRGS
jgi:uncharacterized protein YeaO (DUF488 family)